MKHPWMSGIFYPKWKIHKLLYHTTSSLFPKWVSNVSFCNSTHLCNVLPRLTLNKVRPGWHLTANSKPVRPGDTRTCRVWSYWWLCLTSSTFVVTCFATGLLRSQVRAWGRRIFAALHHYDPKHRASLPPLQGHVETTVVVIICDERARLSKKMWWTIVVS